MEDDIYTDAEAWHRDVVKSYKSVGGRGIAGATLLYYRML